VSSTSAASGEFDAALSLTARAPGTYDAHLSDIWRIGNAINGGLLLSVMGAALRETCGEQGHPDPFSVSAYYLSASVEGPATVRTEVVRSGRTVTTAAARLTQQDENGAEVERIRALATYGKLADLSDDVHVMEPLPDVPAPEECLSNRDMPETFLSAGPFLRRLDVRMDPATAGWAVGTPARQGVIQAWVRMPDGRDPDPLMLLLAVDCLPPATFDFNHFGWVPTLELTAHVRGEPGPGWLFVRHRTRNYAGGLLEEDADVWDSTGRVVAQSRQLARAPRRRPRTA
jgi:Thioesterase-like superfamily